jgi:glyoxylase-like metal-dependent hydrolase (beta-lactamase superfamily II)/rhodanese-related sulfurtransferase
MIIEQLYTGCLAEAAYYIESKGEVAIIDPLRETDQYIELANKSNASIKYIFETHFHADFVSGHIDLANKSGATIVYGPTASTNFPCHIAQDNEIFYIGDIKIKVLHTPGHTLESVTYLLFDENDKEHAIFTGDTLFIGDVGRPDLAIKSDLTEADLAAMLYKSLNDKIKPLPDEVIVYPAHGAGSACGKNLSKETFDTLGNQKKSNYALQATSEAIFVEQLLDGLKPPPQYFAKNAALNKNGYESFDSILSKGLKPISINYLQKLLSTDDILLLDTRSPLSFCKAHIPNSVFIGIDGGFAPWVGALIPNIEQKIIIVADPGREAEVITRLSRVGYDNSLGFVDGGVEAWANANLDIASIPSISSDSFKLEFDKDPTINIIDVRKESEYESEHIKNAMNKPLDWINDQLDDEVIDNSETSYIHCQGGYRSVIAASIWKKSGFHNLVNIEGGFKELKELELPLTEFVCPNSLL